MIPLRRFNRKAQIWAAMRYPSLNACPIKRPCRPAPRLTARATSRHQRTRPGAHAGGIHSLRVARREPRIRGIRPDADLFVATCEPREVGAVHENVTLDKLAWNADI